jgi:uncharacterized membrane protein
VNKADPNDPANRDQPVCSERKNAIRAEVYGKIDDKATLRYLSFQRISWIDYVAGVVISILALLASLRNGIL